MEDTIDDIEKMPEPWGPYHAFWLFREGERQYLDYWRLLGRKDAPVRILDQLLRTAQETLCWVPSINPGRRTYKPSLGLHWYGPTIINRTGGECLRQICSGWAQILSQGPELLIMSHGWEQEPENAHWKVCRFKTSRDEYVAKLEQLAEYGRLVATGDYFLIHLGI